MNFDQDNDEEMVTVPTRFIVYENADIAVADPFTVVYPDGSVFLFAAAAPHTSRFLCRYRNFTVDPTDVEVFSIPVSLLKQIIKMEA